MANEGQVALSDISQGEVLMSSRFGKEVPRPDSLDIPAGKMAVTVELADPQRVAPFLRAGDEVAIFTSFKNRRIPKKDEPKADGECGYPELCATQVVLTRVLVLGVGEATTKPAPKRKVDDEIAPSAQEEQEQRAQITLALTQKEAAKVVHLSFFGNMHFALLNDRSVIDKETAGVNDNNFFADK